LVVPRYGAEEEAPGVIRVPGRAVPRDPEDRFVHWGAMHRAVHQAAVGCDLIHVQTPFIAHPAGVKAARALGLPVLATYHTLFEEYLHHYVPVLPRSLTRPMARRFSSSQCNQLDAVIAPSQAMHDALLGYGVTRRIEILPTGLPQDRFVAGDGPAFRERHGIAAGRSVLLFVGRAAHEKNIGFLLEMMVELRRRRPDALLVVAGEGPASGHLHAQAGRLGLGDAVRFLGYFDRGGELQDCYRAADLFVFASLTETQGLVLLEAMAQGVPVVAIPRMGTIDILAPQRGCRHAPHSVQGFAATVDALLSDPEVLRGLGPEARAYAGEWSSRRMAGRLAALYASLAASCQGQSRRA
jgi:glycosyltransferase involved in cell wall biosynthesis